MRYPSALDMLADLMNKYGIPYRMDFDFYFYQKKSGFKLTQAPERHTASQTLPVKEPFKRIHRRMGRM